MPAWRFEARSSWISVRSSAPRFASALAPRQRIAATVVRRSSSRGSIPA
ncbi:hypothetical protein SCE1572_15240 [Sorangium cellulosum So0157-2]|uniref:Uncharacterized protein n=1 Tax=Sorangium cellulosum So0157-2 TaxID=1254432 RepID=S4XYQ8_SORCE|nr:hypothetical protein SCE1572_15240 [Sorangium cellulosum So0157-2]